MDLRQAVGFFVGSQDGLLHDVPHAGRLRRFDGVPLEFRLIQRVGPEEKQFVASLKRRSKSLGPVVVDDDGLNPA